MRNRSYIVSLGLNGVRLAAALKNATRATRRVFLAKRGLLTASLLIAMLVMSGCGDAEITTVNSQDEAIEILTVLYDNGVDSYMQEVGEEGAKQWKIFAEGKLFESGVMARAHRVLRDNGLPRPSDQGREAAAKEEGLLKSVSAEKAKRLKEMETEIERQLRLLPAVVRVKTNVAPAEDDPVQINPAPATASVVVVCREKQPGFTEQHVKELVAGGVPRLKAENVRVAITYDPPRPLAPREIDKSSRNRIVSGVLVVSLLSLVLIGLVIHSRRKRGATSENIPDQSPAVDDGEVAPSSGS